MNSCWNSTKYLTPEGYARVKVGGRMILLHRLVYEGANGTIPQGMVVCHECDNPSCIRPDHLFLGTQLDNIADRDRKNRCKAGSYLTLRTHCPKGHAYEGYNLIVRNGKRECRECKNHRNRLKSRNLNQLLPHLPQNTQ